MELSKKPSIAPFDVMLDFLKLKMANPNDRHL